MKQVIYNKFNKHAIGNLPRVLFKGRIFVVISKNETNSAIDYLLSQKLLGIDTETRPIFKKGDNHLVSLLQVSTKDTCFLFRLNFTGITPAIKRFLEDLTVTKVGLSLHDDFLSLHKRANFTPGSFIDLQNLVGQIGIEDMSLQKLYANLFGEKISKRQQLSNWDSPVLTEAQKLYAATDAWACVQLYEKLMALEIQQNYQLIKVPEKTQTQIETNI